MSEMRSAFRTLLQRPQFTCVSVLLLAFGVGAATVLFALADAVMFRPFPFADQDRLVIGAEHRAGWPRAEVSHASFRDWRARSVAFDGLAAMGSSNWTMTLRATDPIAIPYRVVSSEFFDVLGVRAALGRTFRPGDDTRGAPRVVVISYGLWQRRFGADPQVVGRSVTLNERDRQNHDRFRGVRRPAVCSRPPHSCEGRARSAGRRREQGRDSRRLSLPGRRGHHGG